MRSSGLEFVFSILSPNWVIAGFKLRLYDIDDSRLSAIRARGGVDVEGDRGGFAPVERATTDLEPAIDGADGIIVVTGGNVQAVVARSLASLLRPDQVILLIQGNTGGSQSIAELSTTPGVEPKSSSSGA